MAPPRTTGQSPSRKMRSTLSVGLPEAVAIWSPKVTAQYHTIYMISLPPDDKTSRTELFLQVSGNHLPTIKTENKFGVMSWFSKNTPIPIPDLVAYDASANNPIAHEYALLSRVDVVTASDLYTTLDDQQIGQVLDQLVNFLSQLHAHRWNAIGGLTLNDRGEAVVGRVVDETFWQTADVDFVSAQVRQCIRLIHVHEKLAFMRDVTPRLEVFLAALEKHADELNGGTLRLAHKELHFATCSTMSRRAGSRPYSIGSSLASCRRCNGTRGDRFCGTDRTRWKA
ncbi:hypothetical protein DL764_001351 [Monosporascus ibericus]|uniref:Aminoglycoside phosphotransferase domain-containing protein n=1 Tax=Monosporascus ibericus TaxID=155417 RepID=A0A4Q4TSA2_9PEZI|nr:hypothetical protein DL764_001351 [Monosporascus ibericus]